MMLVCLHKNEVPGLCLMSSYLVIISVMKGLPRNSWEYKAKNDVHLHTDTDTVFQLNLTYS